MARKRYTVEQSIAKLREAEIELAQGAQRPPDVRFPDLDNRHSATRKSYAIHAKALI